jgi:preprotein translocase subunit SecG
MITLLAAIHVLVSVFLIFVVLIQGGKGADLGAAFGGSSQTLFGGRGAATFLSKLTTVMAALFMVTSLLLTIYSLKGHSMVRAPRQSQPQQSFPLSQNPNPPAGPAQRPANQQNVPPAGR